MKKIGNSHFNLRISFLGIFFSCIFLTLIPADIESKDIEVSAVVSPRHIQYNEKATMELTISGKTQIKHIGAPQFNFLPNFLTAPLGSKTIPRLIDDKVAVSMTWIYELIPQKLGELVLPDVSFTYQGISYMANPGKIIVGASDMYQNTSTGGIHRVTAEVDNHQPYINERIEYRFRYLYTTVLPTPRPPTPKLPKFTGFIVEEYQNEHNTTEILNGKKFHIKERVLHLYPKNSGKILIKPAELILHLSEQPKTLKSKPIPITVQPLPVLARPDSFNGAVGKYDITADVDRKRLKVRDGLTLTIKIEGVGNHKSLNPPKISINNFRVDPPKPVQGDSESDTHFSYVVIPLMSGILQIPAIEFSFYNPTDRSYQTTKTTPIPITVIPTTPIANESGSIFPNWILWVMSLLLVITLSFVGFLFYKSKWQSDRATSSSDAINPNLSENISIDLIDNVATDKDSTSYVAELVRIIHQSLCKKTHEPYRQLTNAEVQDMCHQAGVPTPLVQEITDIIAKCEQHRFAPIPLSTEERDSLLTRTKAIVQQLEST